MIWFLRKVLSSVFVGKEMTIVSIWPVRCRVGMMLCTCPPARCKIKWVLMYWYHLACWMKECTFLSSTTVSSKHLQCLYYYILKICHNRSSVQQRKLNTKKCSEIRKSWLWSAIRKIQNVTRRKSLQNLTNIKTGSRQCEIFFVVCFDCYLDILSFSTLTIFGIKHVWVSTSRLRRISEAKLN